MFLRCRNPRPLLPSVAWGGRTHAAPQERGKIRGSPTRFPPAPRARARGRVSVGDPRLTRSGRRPPLPRP